MRAALPCLLIAVALTGGCARASDTPACSPAQRKVPDAGELEAEEHRRFDVPVVDLAAGQHAGGHSFFDLRVDESGRVVCFVDPSLELSKLTPAQRAVLRHAGTWRYAPFLRGGKPASVMVSQRYFEQLPPKRRVAAPQVPDDQVSVSFVQGQGFFGGPAYAVHIRADGWVGFHATTPVAPGGSDVEGTFAYRVPSADVARLIALVRDPELWSADARYRGDTTDQPTQWLIVRMGDKTMRIKDYAGRYAGMPAIVTRVQEEAAQVARAEQWTVLSRAALDQLQREGFDFRSPAAGRMLARAVFNRRARDDAAMLRLLELGAPIDAPIRGHNAINRGEATMIEEALVDRRTRLVAPLIARGALETKGRSDQDKIDAAFRAAVVGGRLRPVQQIWAVAGTRPHPALTFRDEGQYEKLPPKEGVPVALLLERGYDDDAWEGRDIARWLAAQGNDLRATRADGKSLLEIAASDTDDRFVRYLLAQGVAPTASGRYEYSPLDHAKVEEVALTLLQAGSELPTQRSGFEVHATDLGWTRVLAWLDAHPNAPVMPLTKQEIEQAESIKRGRELLSKCAEAAKAAAAPAAGARPAARSCGGG